MLIMQIAPLGRNSPSSLIDLILLSQTRWLKRGENTDCNYGHGGEGERIVVRAEDGVSARMNMGER